MRFTRVLFMPQNVPRLRDASWQRWRKRKVFDDGITAKLEALGIEIVDANEYVRRDSPLFKDLAALPDVEPIFPQPLKRDSTHPLWNDRCAKILSAENFPMDGVKQAQVFSKSVQVKKGLPDAILELSQSTKLKDQDDLVQNVIQHSFMWDAHLENLPGLRSLKIPCFNFRKTYGIKAETSNELVIRNLLRLCEVNFPSDASRTLIGGKTELEVCLEREGFPVQIRLSPLVTILSKHALRPFLPNAQVTKEMELPDIRPFSSLLNFEEENIYDTEDQFGFRSDCGFPHIHTSVFAHEIPGSFTHVHPRWNYDRFSGSTLLYGFATALLMARRIYGKDITSLPEPVTTQTIHFTGREWQFSVFQLNTLDFEATESGTVKNVAWLTDTLPLFAKCGYDYVQGREIFEGFNPQVFRLLRGIYSASTTEPFPQIPPALPDETPKEETHLQ